MKPFQRGHDAWAKTSKEVISGKQDEKEIPGRVGHDGAKIDLSNSLGMLRIVSAVRQR